MQIALYIIWFLIPLVLFCIGLWTYLEKLSGKARTEDHADFFKQGLFVLICALISVAIDRYLLKSLEKSALFEMLPLQVWQIALLPLVLFIAAWVLGPSKQILIKKAPRPSESQEKRKRKR